MNHLLKIGIVKCEWIKNLCPSGADIHQTVQFSGSNLSSRPAVIRRRTIFCVLHHSLFPHSFGERFNPKSVKPGQGGAGQRLLGCREDMEVLTAASSRRLFFHNKSLKKKRWLFSTVLPQSLLPGSQTKFGLILNDNNVSHDFHLKFSFL